MASDGFRVIGFLIVISIMCSWIGLIFFSDKLMFVMGPAIMGSLIGSSIVIVLFIIAWAGSEDEYVEERNEVIK